MNPRSSVSLGQEHWPRLRICKYGQRLGPLNTSTTVPHLQPQDWNCPEESPKKGDNARHKYISCTFLSPCSVRSHLPRPYQYNRRRCSDGWRCRLQREAVRSVPQFMNRAIGPVFQQLRALTLGCLQISCRDGRRMRQPVGLWAKQKQTARSAFQTDHRVQLWELGGRRESVLRCSVAQKVWSRRAEITLEWRSVMC